MVMRHLVQATSCTGDIVYIHGHLYTQTATSYRTLALILTLTLTLTLTLIIAYDVTICVYKCPLMYTMSHVHDVACTRCRVTSETRVWSFSLPVETRCKSN